MSFNYSASQAAAKKLLDKFGQLGYVKLRTETGAISDPIEGDTPGTILDTDLFAVDLAVDKAFVDDELIKTTDRMVICSSDAKPDTSDKMLVGTVEHTILAVKPISPAGTDVIYKVAISGN